MKKTDIGIAMGGVGMVVTKDGGAVGGFMEKAKACAYCGARLLVLRRPRENGETVESILERCRELL